MLTICPTPIGNLDDVTARQYQALSEADVLACEDSRRSGKLLELLGISRADGQPRLVSYHDHNAAGRTPELVDELAAGNHVVLVTDAGTPTISDPGYRLVRAAAEAGHDVVALPGPVAAMVALSAAGMPTDRFFFEGFLATKSVARRRRLGQLRDLEVTVVLYESPRRVVDLLADIDAVYGSQHPVCVARELTKMHEQYVRGRCQDVAREVADGEVRGEFVVVVGPWEPADDTAQREAEIDAKIAELLNQNMRPRGVKEVIAELYDVSKSSLYKRIERVREAAEDGGHHGGAQN